MENLNNEQKQTVTEINEEFTEFLKTKGIKAKFKLAFSNMAESAKKQHEIDVANFEAVKQKSIEENKEFYEFLHTKGFKAKVRLVIENIKKGAKESKIKTKEQIAKSNSLSNRYLSITEEELQKQFNEFLSKKGLDNKFCVKIEEINE